MAELSTAASRGNGGNLDVWAGQWLGCWVISGHYFTGRTLGVPETRVPGEVVPAELLAVLYKFWRGGNPQGDPPGELQWGEDYLDDTRQQAAVIPPEPTLWADREFLRFCLSYIERAHDWSEADFEISFSRAPGQLMIKMEETEVFCPARGQWPRRAVVSARELFRRIPKRFTSDVVCLRAGEDRILLDSHWIKARWEEPVASVQVGDTDFVT